MLLRNSFFYPYDIHTDCVTTCVHTLSISSDMQKNLRGKRVVMTQAISSGHNGWYNHGTNEHEFPAEKYMNE